MTVVAATFGALSEVQMMQVIYHFKAQEVNNPMLQTVHDSELKRRSCSHYKSVTLKCCGISLLLREFRNTFVHTEEARAKNGSGLRLRKTRKGGWMRGTGQNDVVLGCFFKKRTDSKTTSFWAQQIKKKFRAGRLSATRLEEEEEEEEEEEGEGEGGVRTWSDRRRRLGRAPRTLRLAGSERLARLSGAFVKGCRLPSGKAPEGGVAPP
ncbi:hypothetical protein VitviT2T_015284 [Vitis vinifera]|uniref:Uncharacterized protein n=1 Tax=Vitis vinifera TaxID=29760 RepID=A0ABY9CN66_VITVI|nr:hypothetical protein VitviT2T_015284 [Vitis vinifera]